jgi:hypothetical protein
MDRKIHGKRLRLRRIAALAFAMAHCTAVIAGDETKTAGVVSADAFGADRSGRSDSTDAIARAIRAVTDRGGGKVEFGPGSYNVAGTIKISESAVTLEGIKGATHIICTGNGGESCLSIEGSDRQVYFATIRDMYIIAGQRTGGSCISLSNVANSVIEDTALGPCYNGVSTDSTNNVVINNFVIQGVHGQYGVKYYTSPGPGRRSDAFTLSNGVVQALHSGADCLVWDGMAVTLRINSVALLGCKIGMHVENSAKAKAGFPGFLFANDLETDNQTEASIIIDGGHDFHFVNSDISNTSGGHNQGSNDLDCVIINPDVGFSYTRNIFFVGSRIGNCRNRAMYINARDVHLTGNNIHSASKAGKDAFPQIEIGPQSTDIEITGGKVSFEFGDPRDASYGVVVAPGAKNVSITGVNFNGNNKGAVLAPDAAEVNIAGGIDHLGQPMGLGNAGR